MVKSFVATLRDTPAFVKLVQAIGLAEKFAEVLAALELGDKLAGSGEESDGKAAKVAAPEVKPPGRKRRRRKKTEPEVAQPEMKGPDMAAVGKRTKKHGKELQEMRDDLEMNGL